MYVYFLVPETKGRTLEEMDELFGVAGTADDERVKENIEREIGLFALLGDDSDAPESPREKLAEEPGENMEAERAPEMQVA